MEIQNRVWHCGASPKCTLVAHETVTLLDTVQTELPQCVGKLRAALAALTELHDLGRDGETLLAWVDEEIAKLAK